MQPDPVANSRSQRYVLTERRGNAAPADVPDAHALPMTPAHALPPIPHIPFYLGTRHPGGPGVHPLPSPPGVDLVAITDERAVVRVVVLAAPDALDAHATGYMRRWWRRRWGSLVRRALLRILRPGDDR